MYVYIYIERDFYNQCMGHLCNIWCLNILNCNNRSYSNCTERLLLLLLIAPLTLTLTLRVSTTISATVTGKKRQYQRQTLHQSKRQRTRTDAHSCVGNSTPTIFFLCLKMTATRTTTRIEGSMQLPLETRLFVGCTSAGLDYSVRI